MTDSATNPAGPEVLVQRRDGVATILLNRASESNPIGWSLGGSLLAALNEVEDDQSVSAIVLTGAGKVFCAGARLGEVVRPEGVDPEDQYYGFRDIVRAVSRIRNHELPIVCALNGGAVGGGAALALPATWCSRPTGPVPAFAAWAPLRPTWDARPPPRLVGSLARDIFCSRVKAKKRKRVSDVLRGTSTAKRRVSSRGRSAIPHHVTL
jgi:hypothetical protein